MNKRQKKYLVYILTPSVAGAWGLFFEAIKQLVESAAKLHPIPDWIWVHLAVLLALPLAATVAVTVAILFLLRDEGA